ncbi:Mu transposase C-terminal domain-containing protein [Bacillus cereus group sp. BfR-BA-00331]|uniref:Mu transposase C-terminal domain-containing protein n=1 Tax=Bacillus cereus group TaxID=86661 RepID=UPI0007725772|nr:MULTISPECIES: Mu transposase C-terminal domain-containing protein [Bacillus cereus group]ONG68739.1 transposase [Bacillus cereus]MDA2195472.1 Mu transposase C-terminal domain-containing protein [Bacillus cereus group sp. Bc238]MDA2200995.1 Mu transposase C-terminal domain-containing protein [Bacillus cereus group sp. Bc237]MDA2759604.1 Mu transposase C-terminal domain-containing protein [Bacillus cereus group sp. Bc007]MDA2765303.1 Mu transposase C-terminal domain-containing protein [Bacill
MIYINQVLQYTVDSKRIRIIEMEEFHVFIVDIDAISSMPKKELYSNLIEEIQQGELLLISDPFAKVIIDSELSDLRIQKRDEGWSIIQHYCLEHMEALLQKGGREKKIKEIADESGTSSTKIKKLLSRYWQRGMTKNAMLPDYSNSGGKGKTKTLNKAKVGRPRKVSISNEYQTGINITDEVKVQFEHAINKYYRASNNYSLKDVYNFILRDFYSDRYKENGEMKYRIWDATRIPSYHQFYYWFKKLEDPKKDIQFRKSTKEYELKYRPILSDSKSETNGPGTRFQVDATIADIYLVSSLDVNKVIGRPVIYAVLDVYSRIITGLYVGLEGPSWIGAMMALDNMIADKVEFCKQYGIDITPEQWPTHHLPEIIIADRGEFEGYSVENLINNLNLKIENTTAYRGDLKGIVERKFRTFNGKVKQKAPGAIQKEYRERGDQDYRLNATLNLKEFTSLIITMALYHNQKVIDKYPVEKEMVADGLVPTPINLWNWGIQNRKGRLRKVDRNVLRLNVLPRGKATVSRAGIKFKNLLYGSRQAIEEQWYLKLKNRSLEIVYDPRHIEKIYIPHDNGMDFETCILLEPSQQYKGDFLEEIVFQQQLRNELEEMERTNQIQLTVNTDAALEEIIKKAVKNKKQFFNQPTSKKAKIAAIRDNKDVEKQLNRETEKFDLSPNKVSEAAEVIDFVTKEKIDETPPKKSSSRLMEKLKKKRDEEFGKDK